MRRPVTSITGIGTRPETSSAACASPTPPSTWLASPSRTPSSPSREDGLLRRPLDHVHQPRGREGRPNEGGSQGEARPRGGLHTRPPRPRPGHSGRRGERVRQDRHRQARQDTGGHVVAPDAGDVIAEVVLAMRKGLPITDLSRTVHVYPTISEGVKGAADSYYRKKLFGGNARRALGAYFTLRRLLQDRRRRPARG